MSMYNIQKFVHYNYKPLSTSQIITRLITVWLLSSVCALLGENRIVWGIGFILCNFVVTALALHIWKAGIDKANSKFLWDGITYMYISIILNLASYRVFVWELGDNLILLLFFVAAILLCFAVSAIIVIHNIKKGRYNEDVQSPSKSAVPYMFGFLGFLFAEYCLQSVKSQIEIQVLAMSLFILSAIVGLGWTNIIRLVLNRRLDNFNN